MSSSSTSRKPTPKSNSITPPTNVFNSSSGHVNRHSLVTNTSASVRQKSFDSPSHFYTNKFNASGSQASGIKNDAPQETFDGNHSPSCSSLYTAPDGLSISRKRSSVVHNSKDPRQAQTLTRRTSVLQSHGRSHNKYTQGLPLPEGATRQSTDNTLFTRRKQYKLFVFRTTGTKGSKIKPTYHSREQLYKHMNSVYRQKSIEQDILPPTMLKFGYSQKQDSLRRYYGLAPVQSNSSAKTYTVASKKKPRFVFRRSKKAKYEAAQHNERKQALKDQIRKLSNEHISLNSRYKDLIDLKNSSKSGSPKRKKTRFDSSVPAQEFDDTSSNYSVQLITNSKAIKSTTLKRPKDRRILFQLLKLNPLLKSQIQATSLSTNHDLILQSPSLEYQSQNGLNYGYNVRESRVPPTHIYRKPSPQVSDHSPIVVDLPPAPIIQQSVSTPLLPRGAIESPITYDFPKNTRGNFTGKSETDNQSFTRDFVRHSVLSNATSGDEHYYTPPARDAPFSPLSKVSDASADKLNPSLSNTLKNHETTQSGASTNNLIAGLTEDFVSPDTNETPSTVNSREFGDNARCVSPEIDVVPVGMVKRFNLSKKDKQKRKSVHKNELDEQLKNAQSHSMIDQISSSRKRKSKLIFGALFGGGKPGIKPSHSKRSSIISTRSDGSSKGVLKGGAISTAGIATSGLLSGSTKAAGTSASTLGAASVGAGGIVPVVSAGLGIASKSSQNSSKRSLEDYAPAPQLHDSANQNPIFSPLVKDQERLIQQIEANSEVNLTTVKSAGETSSVKSNPLLLRVTNISADEYKRYSDLVEENKDKVINPDYVISDNDDAELQRELDSFDPKQIQRLIQEKLAIESGLAVLDLDKNLLSPSHDKFYTRRNILDSAILAANVNDTPEVVENRAAVPEKQNNTAGDKSLLNSTSFNTKSTGSHGSSDDSGASQGQSYEVWGQYMKTIVNNRISYRLNNSILGQIHESTNVRNLKKTPLGEEHSEFSPLQLDLATRTVSNNSYVTAISDIDSLKNETIARSSNSRAYGSSSSIKNSIKHNSSSNSSSSTSSKKPTPTTEQNAHLAAIREREARKSPRNYAYGSDRSGTPSSQRSNDSVSVRSLVGNRELKLTLSRSSAGRTNDNYKLGDLSNSQLNLTFKHMDSPKGSLRSKSSHSSTKSLLLRGV